MVPDILPNQPEVLSVGQTYYRTAFNVPRILYILEVGHRIKEIEYFLEFD